MEVKISQLFDYGDEIAAPGEAPAFDPGEIKELTMKRIHGERNAPKPARAVRRASRTLLIAAILATLFTITALAAGLSIHQRRQEELRRRNEIDAHQVTDYVEFDTAEDAAGVTLLSTINNGDNQVVYLNLSPVEEDEVYDPGMQDMMSETGVLRCYVMETDAGSGWGMLEYMPDDWDFPPEEMMTVTLEGGHTLERPTPEAMHRKLLESCYDAQSKTLTLKGYVPSSQLAPGKAVQLHVMLLELRDGDDGSTRILRDFGRVSLSPTEQTIKTVRFDDPPVFLNEETGEEGRVLGVELNYEGASWLVSFDDMQFVHSAPAPDLTLEQRRAKQDLERSWGMAEDEVVWNAKLNFADGSSMDAPGILRCPYEEGVVKLMGNLGEGTLALDQIVSVTVCGKTFPVK